MNISPQIPSYDAHVHWTRCRRFQVPVSVRQPAEDVPPVGHDGDEPCDCAARLQILRDESAPAVLVLVLVEIVLAVAAIPVDLRKRCRIEFPVVRDERTAVPASADPVLDEFELALDQLGRVLLTIRPSPSNAASAVSFLSRLMWTYRVNPQTIAGTVVPTMSRTSGAFGLV